MSPEQARGQAVDKRTDLWSFGCLVYALLAGLSPFAAETTSDTIAAILGREPDWDALPRDTPPQLRGLLRRCLEKDSSQRLRDAGDARLEIEEALAEYRGTSPCAPRRSWTGPFLVVLVVGLVVGLVFVLRSRNPLATRALLPKLFQVTFSEGIEEFPAWLPILKQNADVWRLPVSPQTGRPLGAPQQVIATTREDSRGAWSPDLRAIAFNSDRSGDMNIWLQSLEDGSARPLTKGPGGDFQPTWSPDGRRIVFFSSRAGNADIWAVEVASGALTQLTRNSSIDIDPFFSPDGSMVAYQSDLGGRLEVWVMDADGSRSRPLTRVGVTGHFLRWTREGDAILFRCPCGGKPQTMRAAVNGDEPQPLAEVAGGSHMSFSPDFSRIMDVVGHKALWVSQLATGKPEKVFEFDDSDVRIDYPVWSPDGHWVLFDRFRPQGGDIWVMEGFE